MLIMCGGPGCATIFYETIMIVRIVYNVVLLLGVIVFAPVLFVKIILTPKYRHRILGRLGMGRQQLLPVPRAGQPRIWIHALSVGEVSSVKTLVHAVRARFPQAALFFSATTQGGEAYARQVLGGAVDSFVPFPIDALPCVKKIVNRVAPDLFILVETDFWPNILWELAQRGVPALLVNGRISAGSFHRYRQLAWFFLPLFKSFQMLAMQTADDAAHLIRLGVPGEQVKVAGNLKYDAAIPDVPNTGAAAAREKFSIPPEAFLWVAGSTHRGEEEIVLQVFQHLLARFPGLFLVIAPRNIERAREVLRLSGQQGSGGAFLRSASPCMDGRIMILDTFGELAALYALCDAAFVGGSLVAEGGHNPLEPAAFARPVVFGPYMDDFQEISRDLLLAGGASMAHSKDELISWLEEMLSDGALRRAVGEKAKKLVDAQRGVTSRHIEIISGILGQVDAVWTR